MSSTLSLLAMNNRAFLLLCAFVLSLAHLQAESDVDKTLRFLPDMVRPLAVKLAIPDDFVVGPAPVILPRDKQVALPLNLASGVLWGTAETIRQINEQPEAKKPLISRGAFRVKMTPNIIQIEPKKFSFGDDESLKADLEKNGAKDIEIKRVMWGEYPVVAATFKLKDSTPQAICWIGVNNNGFTLFISYVFPPNKSSYADDFVVWNTFINNSSLLPPREFLKAQGYEFDEGTTTFSRARAKLKFTSQKVKGEKTVILIEFLTNNTTCTVIEATRRTATEARSTRIDLVVEVDSSIEDIKASGEEMIPIFPKNVPKITLTGTKLYEDLDVLVLGSREKQL